MDTNPFAPPRTTDLGGPRRSVLPQLLDPEALRLLVSAGRWARWAGFIGLLALLFALFELAGMVLAPRKIDTSATVVTVAIVSVPLGAPLLGLFAWLSWRFARATAGLVGDDVDAVDAAMRVQRRLFMAYGIVALVAAAVVVLGLTVATVMAGMRRR